MASIPTNGYAEVMAGTNNYSGSNSYDGSCPRTAIPPVIGDDLCNKTYVDGAGGGLIGSLTDKGSLITADGTQAVIFDQNPYGTALTTTTVYDWNSLAVAQSRNFTTTAPTTIPLGASITITYSGTDSITGTITAIAGTTITITITALASATYTPAVLLTTTAPDTSTFAGAVFNGQTFPLAPATTTPPTAQIPAFSMITSGSCNVFQNAGGGGNFFFRLLGTGVQRGDSSTQALGTALIGTPNPTALTWSGTNGGCFYNSATAQIPLPLLSIIEPSPPKAADFQYPLGGGFNPPNYCGQFTGYALSYGTGSITITGNIALLADPVSSTGLIWGVVSGGGGGGSVNSVSGGTNVIISGSLSAPVVNLRNPLTAELNCGTQSLRDRVSSVGTSGQVLTAGTGGQVLWGAAAAETLDATLAAGNTATGTYATITLTDTDTGGQANPILTLNNTNATGSVALEIYKNKPTAGVAGDVLFNQSVYGKDAGNNKQEYTRISHTLRDGTAGVEDGSIEMGCFVNGSFNNFLQINGNENEVNLLKPIDMTGNAIITRTGNLTLSTASAVTGNGDILVNTVGATGTGHIHTTSKSATTITSTTGGINLTANGGATIQANTTGSILLNGGTNLTLNATTGVFGITNELHYGIISTPTPTHIYRPTLQPLITTSSYAVNSTELLKEGELFTFINSLGDGGNELITVSTPNFTATCMEYVLNSASATNCYAAGGYNHIEGRAELRFATDINSIFNTISSGTFQFIYFGASQRINCLCYDPVNIADKMVFGGNFTGIQGQSYNGSGGTFPSNISAICVVDITNFGSIAPIDMGDNNAGSPTENCFGVNGEVLCCGTRAYDNTFYLPASAPFYLFGGAFTQLTSSTGSPTPPAALRMINYCPNGSLVPFGAKWWDFGGANANITACINDDIGRIAYGGQFTSIGSSPTVSFLAYTEPALLSSFTYDAFDSGSLNFPVSVGKANFGYFNNTYASGSTFSFGYDDSGTGTVQQADLNNHTGAYVLIKNTLTSTPLGIAVDLDVATPVVNFIVGTNYCWDNTVPHYVDLNGSVDLGNTFYQTQATPNLPLFFKKPDAAPNPPTQYSLFQPTGAGSCLITSLNTPFINGLAPANKYSKITLAAKDNFAMGTLVGFGGDDQRILITSQFGATFAI